MPRVINLDALIVNTVTVNLRMPDGSVKTFDLKDDVPVTVGVLTLALMQKELDLKAAETAGEPAFSVQAKRLDMMSADITHILGEIFRHSYPEMTDEELAALIPPGAGMEIVKVFFTSLSSRFSVPGSSSDSSSSSSPADSQTAAPEPSSDAIPSPNTSSEEQAAAM